MRFAGKADEFHILLEPLQGGIKLLGLFDGAAPVFFGMDNEEWGLDLFDVGDGRAFPVFFQVFPRKAANFFLREPPADV